MRKLISLLVCFWICSDNSDVYAADVVKVAAASNFLLPLKKLKSQFELASNSDLIISSGSTAKLYAQIMNGAPFDVFLSADQSTVKKLIKNKRANQASEITYARGQLVLWGGKTNLQTSSLLSTLQTGSFNRLSIANPKLAPYGRAAIEVLQNLKIDLDASRRLVFGENIGQAFQFVHSGNADLGMVALSQLKVLPNAGNYWVIPLNLYHPLHQSAVLLQRAEHNLAASKFLQFLASPKTQEIIVKEYGYLSEISADDKFSNLKKSAHH